MGIGCLGVGGGGLGWTLLLLFFFIQYFSNILVHPLPSQPRHQGLSLREWEVRSEMPLGRGWSPHTLWLFPCSYNREIFSPILENGCTFSREALFKTVKLWTRCYRETVTEGYRELDDLHGGCNLELINHWVANVKMSLSTQLPSFFINYGHIVFKSQIQYHWREPK